MSHNFKPGDTVIRTGDDYRKVQKGGRYVVERLHGNHSLILVGRSGSYDAASFKAAPAQSGAVFCVSPDALDRRIFVAPQDTPKLQWTAIVGEKSRTYHFPDGSKFTVEGVVRLCVRPTNHRLVTGSGKKFVVPGKFIAIEIDAEVWSA